jgi:hypothetical protein
VPELKVREQPPSTLRNIDGGPSGGVRAGGPGAPTINAKKRRQRAPGRCWSWRTRSAHHQCHETSTAAPREVPELVVRERPPSTLRNIDGGPPGGARAGGLRAPTINAKNIDGGAQEVPTLEVLECPPSTLRNIDGGPPRGDGAGDPGAQRLWSPPLGQSGEWLQKSRDKCSKNS